jgi:hypothetical protein
MDSRAANTHKTANVDDTPFEKKRKEKKEKKKKEKEKEIEIRTEPIFLAARFRPMQVAYHLGPRVLQSAHVLLCFSPIIASKTAA